jgi:para-aminobenzoate synthetase component 1
LNWKFESLPYSRTSTEWLSLVADLPYAFALQGGACDGQRYDLIGAEPSAIISTSSGTTTVIRKGKDSVTDCNPFEAVERELDANRPATPYPYDMPFSGGAVGFFGYELAHELERLPEAVEDKLDFPDMVVGIYDWFITIDHEDKSASLVATPHVSEIEFERLRARLLEQPTSTGSFEVRAPIAHRTSREQYNAAIDRIQQYIEDGDCYQVNYTQRFEADLDGNSLALYEAILAEHSAPYAAYLATPRGEILSFSPERFLRIDGDRVTTQPIKGTRPRGDTTAEDEAMANALANSEKDRAENLMIVDLLRNDLGRCCVPGSIEVTSLFELHSFPNVHHLVSTVTGRLPPDTRPMDVFSAAFPGGSITGAPKIRAMEIIAELEPVRRSAYCGAIGYYGYDGNLDTNLAIRTMVVSDGRIHYWGGGGIVADSTTEEEYQESLAKVGFIRNVLEQPPKQRQPHQKVSVTRRTH